MKEFASQQNKWLRLCLGAAAAMFLLSCGACKTIKPYEKEYLLHPFMDDMLSLQLTPDYATFQTFNYEKLSAALSGGMIGSACPTCGG